MGEIRIEDTRILGGSIDGQNLLEVNIDGYPIRFEKTENTGWVSVYDGDSFEIDLRHAVETGLSPTRVRFRGWSDETDGYETSTSYGSFSTIGTSYGDWVAQWVDGPNRPAGTEHVGVQAYFAITEEIEATYTTATFTDGFTQGTQEVPIHTSMDKQDGPDRLYCEGILGFGSAVKVRARLRTWYYVPPETIYTEDPGVTFQPSGLTLSTSGTLDGTSQWFYPDGVMLVPGEINTVHCSVSGSDRMRVLVEYTYR